MRNFLIITALSAIAFSACSQQKKVTSSTSTAGGTTTTTTTTTSTSTTAVGKTTYVKMERTPCFGRCPHYNLEFWDNGLVRYTGINSTDMQGTYEKNMDAKKIKTFLKQLDTYRVDTCQAEYEPLVTDVPGLNFTISRGEETNKIRYANFGPGFLGVLATEMDNMATPDKTWKKVNNITD